MTHPKYYIAFEFCARSWFAHPAPLCDRLCPLWPSCGVDACVLLPIRGMDGWVGWWWVHGWTRKENPSTGKTLWKHILATCSLDRSYSDIEFIERIWKCYACERRVERGFLLWMSCRFSLRYRQESAPSNRHDWSISAMHRLAYLYDSEFQSQMKFLNANYMLGIIFKHTFSWV